MKPERRDRDEARERDDDDDEARERRRDGDDAREREEKEEGIEMKQ